MNLNNLRGIISNIFNSSGEAQDVIVLGKSNKRCKNPIGYQGNGLKS